MVILIVIMSVTLACEQKPTSAVSGKPSVSDSKPDEVLARVNDAPITQYQLSRWFEGIRAQPSAENMKNALDKMIFNEIIYQKGIELGLDEDADYRFDLWNFQRRKMVRRVFDHEARNIRVTSDDALAYFKEHQEAIQSEYHLLAIYFPDEKQAREALVKLKDKVPFVKLAPQAGKSGKKVGLKDLGFLPWHKLNPNWTDEIQKLKQGEVSPLLPGSYVTKNILVKLAGKRTNSKIDFKRVKGSLIEKIRDERFTRFIKNLEANSKVERF
ncbi:MAG: hypothetical protein OEY59_13080 [Deltaproteobacteria bacterium]|nr:hypothetical protein [Deltaproteobacteria bacterium]